MNARRPLLLLLMVLAIGGALYWALSRDHRATRTVSATIETDDIRVASRYGGRVVSIQAHEGETLVAGQPILMLEAPELAARRDHAAAVLREREHGPRTEEIAAALAEREALTAQLAYARAELERARELFADQTISATERDQAVSRADALTKSQAAAEQRYQLLQTGTRPEQLDQARASLAELESMLKELTITAPTNTTCELIHVKVGDVLAPGQAAATLLLADQLWVRVYVPELWLGRISVGEDVAVRVDSHPDAIFRGRIVQINREAEFTPRNVQTVGERVKQVFGVKVSLPTENGVLKAGMAADVEFPGVPRVPSD